MVKLLETGNLVYRQRNSYIHAVLFCISKIRLRNKAIRTFPLLVPTVICRSVYTSKETESRFRLERIRMVSGMLVSRQSMIF